MFFKIKEIDSVRVNENYFGLIIKKGINVWNNSSKVSEFVIQYRLDKKYPNPNIQPIQKDDDLPKCLLDIR